MSWAARSFKNNRGRFQKNRDRFGPFEPSVDLDQHRGQRPFGSGETLYLRLEPEAWKMPNGSWVRSNWNQMIRIEQKWVISSFFKI